MFYILLILLHSKPTYTIIFIAKSKIKSIDVIFKINVLKCLEIFTYSEWWKPYNFSISNLEFWAFVIKAQLGDCLLIILTNHAFIQQRINLKYGWKKPYHLLTNYLHCITLRLISYPNYLQFYHYINALRAHVFINM